MGRALIKSAFKKTGGRISGKVYFDDTLVMAGVGALNIMAASSLIMTGAYGGFNFFNEISEIITIPVGQGAAGVWGSQSLGKGASIILSVISRITQAPGGGATCVDIGRAGNIDEFLEAGTVGLGDTSLSAEDGDGVNLGPVFNGTDCVFKVTTDANVTGTDMKIQITSFYLKQYPPT